MKCDACSKEITSAEMHTVPGATVVAKTADGFVPSKVGAYGAASVGLQFGLSKSEIWKNSVNDFPTSQWGFCSECHTELLNFGKGDGCFIATVCYGSNTANEVILLQWFRDEYLSKNRLGRNFISAYYAFSPMLASFISRHPKLIILVRTGFVGPLVNVVRKIK